MLLHGHKACSRFLGFDAILFVHRPRRNREAYHQYPSNAWNYPSSCPLRQIHNVHIFRFLDRGVKVIRNRHASIIPRGQVVRSLGYVLLEPKRFPWTPNFLMVIVKSAYQLDIICVTVVFTLLVTVQDSFAILHRGTLFPPSGGSVAMTRHHEVR